MTLEEAHKLLGTNDDSSPEDIRRAYLVQARTRHPDLNGGAHGDLMAQLNQARTMLTKTAQEDYCRECGGKGKIVITQGFYSVNQFCVACGGTGKRH